MKKQVTATLLTRAAMIAALYVVLTFVSNAFGLASGAIQVRISEALCVMPVFFPEAVGGLTLGCFVANLLCGCAMPDVIFGSIATLIGAMGTRFLRKYRIPALLPPIISNTVIIPLVLRYVYGLSDAWWYMIVTVCVGEIVSAGIFGYAFARAFDKVIRKTY